MASAVDATGGAPPRLKRCKMGEAYIVEPIRTPGGCRKGALAGWLLISPSD